MHGKGTAWFKAIIARPATTLLSSVTGRIVAFLANSPILDFSRKKVW